MGGGGRAHRRDLLSRALRRRRADGSLLDQNEHRPDRGLLDRPALTMRNAALAALATSLWARASRSGPKRSPPRAGRGPRAIVTARSAAYPQWDDDGRQDGANEGPRSSGNRILVAADQPDEAPLHAHAVGAEDAGLVGGICRFERNGVAPAP